jgi:hypothetical protein
MLPGELNAAGRNDHLTRSCLQPLGNCAGLEQFVTFQETFAMPVLLSSTRGALGGEQSVILCAERTAGAVPIRRTHYRVKAVVFAAESAMRSWPPDHNYFITALRPSSKRLSSSQLRRSSPAEKRYFRFGRVRIIVPNTRSPTVFAALARESHFIWRSPFSNQLVS